jgi:hypothetical protein
VERDTSFRLLPNSDGFFKNRKHLNDRKKFLRLRAVMIIFPNIGRVHAQTRFRTRDGKRKNNG